MSNVSLTIDGRPVTAQPGQKVLWAALAAGIYIPNLCALQERETPFGACRLCFVEIEGRPQPVASCVETVAEGMVVTTSSPRVDRLRRNAAELIIASHDVSCATCAKNRRCDLQKVAAFLKVKLRGQRFRKKTRGLPVDDSHPRLRLDPNKCVLCGKCVWVCHRHHDPAVLNFIGRGDATVVGTFFGDPLGDSACDGCLQCAEVCPVGALVAKQVPHLSS